MALAPDTIKQRNSKAAHKCPLHHICRRFLLTLSRHHIDRDLGVQLNAGDFESSYLESEQDHCYCKACDPGLPDVLENVGGTKYEIPKGWCGFGLKLPSRATALKIFEKWPVTFHGCKASNLPSILREGSLLMPGDKLMDGTELKNAHTVTGQDNSRLQIWTSPSVLYSELDIYTEPVAFEGHNMRVVLQCRQNPNSISRCGETIGWTSKFGTVPISPHVDNKEIECFTTSRGAVIPYRVLIKMNSETRENQEWCTKTFNSLNAGDKCRVVADASIAALSSGIPAAPEVLNVLGRVGKVVKKESHQILVSFKIASSAEGGFTKQQVTLRKCLVESAQQLRSRCNGQQLRVVAAKKHAQKACKDWYVVSMDKYLGRCGLLVEKLADRCQLQFDDDCKVWWGFGALEVPVHILADKLSEGACLDVKWEFAEGEQWSLFDKAAVSAVEGALNNCQPVVHSTFVNRRTQKETVYHYDLARMLQTNTTTTFTRAIRRSVKQQ